MTLRLTATAGVVLCWLLLCAWAWRRAPRARARNAARQALDQPPPRAAVLVAHASQTGCAETLAGQTADSLRAGGLDVRVAALGQLDLARLRGYERVLFVASTYGEGDPPDAAAAFASLMQTGAAGAAPQLRACATPCWRWATANTRSSAASAARLMNGCAHRARSRCSTASTWTTATPPRCATGSIIWACWPAAATCPTGKRRPTNPGACKAANDSTRTARAAPATC